MATKIEPASVLIVDDEEAFRESTADLLRECGYTCDCAADGPSAEKLLRSSSYDLVVADILMPGNSRLEFITSMRTLASDTCAVLVTGYPSLDTALGSMRLDIAAYLVKPIEMKEFLDSVVRGVTRTRARRALRQTHLRLQQQADELLETQHIAAKESGRGGRTESQVFLDLTMVNIASSLRDLLWLAGAPGTQAHPEGPEGKAVCNLFHCPRLDVLRENIAHTINVLERTKQSFKSKDLGELRQRLEDVLYEGST